MRKTKIRKVRHKIAVMFEAIERITGYNRSDLKELGGTKEKNAVRIAMMLFLTEHYKDVPISAKARCIGVDRHRLYNQNFKSQEAIALYEQVHHEYMILMNGGKEPTWLWS